MTDMENDPTAGMISSGRAALVCVQVDIPRNASAPARLRRIQAPVEGGCDDAAVGANRSRQAWSMWISRAAACGRAVV
jgi:hypothetical protein